MNAEQDIEATYDATDFVAKLRRLADALENGTPFHIEIDGKRFDVPHDALLSVEHESEDGHTEIEFQLSWTDEDYVDEDEDEETEEEDEPEEEERKDA